MRSWRVSTQHQPVRRLRGADGVAHFIKGVVEQVHGVVAWGRQRLEQGLHGNVPLRAHALEQLRERPLPDGIQFLLQLPGALAGFGSELQPLRLQPVEGLDPVAVQPGVGGQGGTVAPGELGLHAVEGFDVGELEPHGFRACVAHRQEGEAVTEDDVHG